MRCKRSLACRNAVFPKKRGYSDREIEQALATAAIIGLLVKTNASISGAECGCQAEIGTACAMTAAALGELFGMSLEQIEYAAENAIEHHWDLRATRYTASCKFRV